MKEKLKEKLEKAKEKTKAAYQQVKATTIGVVELCKENKEVAAAVFTAVITVGTTAYKGHSKKADYKRKKDERDRDIYDPHTGRHHYLRRPMTTREQRRFNERIKKASETGETYFDILDDMGLLD